MRDRFTNLPDSIAHQIFSFLDLKDITLVGCVSKRCREFHLSTPSLDFDFDEFPNLKRSSCRKRLELMSSLDELLAHRGDNKIQSFRIYWAPHNSDVKDCSCDESFRIMTWVHDAVRCKVEMLHLDISVEQETPLAFSSLMLLCRSLRSLSLIMKCILKAPRLDSTSNLKRLDLREVRIVGEEFFTWISYCCRYIKELHLQDIHGIKNITIESSSLESFTFECPGFTSVCKLDIAGEKLECCHISWGNLSLRKQSLLSLFAPNLKTLTWLGNLFFHRNLGKFMCLEKAELSLRPSPEVEFDIIYKILCSMHGVSTLILHKETVKAMLKESSVPTFYGTNVRYLDMHIEGFFDNLVPAFASFLGGMSELSTLYVKSDQLFLHPETKSSGFDMEYWKVQNLGFINQLRLVSIELPNGSNGIELAKYILEHAQKLEKMVIVHSPEHSHVIRELNESKSISSATIVFQEDQKRGTVARGSDSDWFYNQILYANFSSTWFVNC